MRGLQKRVLSASLWLTVLLVLASCGPSGPKPGTPAFYWQEARKNSTARDYAKTAENLTDITNSENEFTARARTWKVLLSAGTAEAYITLADAYQAGGKSAGKDMPLAARRKMNEYRNLGGRKALEFAQEFLNWEKADKDPNITLDFPFPVATGTDIPELTRIANGAIISDATMPAVEARAMEQAVAKAVAAAVGATGDLPKAQALFQAGAVQAPRDTFLLAMANSLYDMAKLFSRGVLDNTQRLELLANKALELLKPMKETDETKDLALRLKLLLKQSSNN
jgi:hypothetical protein